MRKPKVITQVVVVAACMAVLLVASYVAGGRELIEVLTW